MLSELFLALQHTFLHANLLVEIVTLQRGVILGLPCVGRLQYAYVLCAPLIEWLHCNLKSARRGSGIQVCEMELCLFGIDC